MLTGENNQQVGDVLRYWRKVRRFSQMHLALEADVSPRHLSFVETGRSRPSADLLMRLAQILKLSHKQTNLLLVSAGYAPRYSDLSLDDERLAPVRYALERILMQHEPYPAVVLDRGYDMQMQNDGFRRLLSRMMGEQAARVDNLYRLMFAPDGLRNYCTDWDALHPILLRRLLEESIAYGSEALAQLYEECAAYVPLSSSSMEIDNPYPVVTLTLMLDGHELSLFSTMTTFGTAIDVTVQELRIESLFPADDKTRHFFSDFT